VTLSSNGPARLGTFSSHDRWSTSHHFTHEGHEIKEVLLQRVGQLVLRMYCTRFSSFYADKEIFQALETIHVGAQSQLQTVFCTRSVCNGSVT
jgi:hypothetical protein